MPSLTEINLSLKQKEKAVKPLKFRYTILYVENVQDTLNFYHKAFGFQQSMLHESGDYGELDTGSTTLSFSAFSLMKELGKDPITANRDRPSFEIALETQDVPTALANALDAGATLVQGTEDMPWGQTIAYVNDPNGFLIELCSPMQAV